MNVVDKFNGLHGAKVSRKELQDIIVLAKEENATDIVYRLSRVLNNNPDDFFKIEIKKYPQGLNAAHHSGIYKEALDDCGRLNPGYKFENGSIVKVTKRKATRKKVIKTVPSNPVTKKPITKPTPVKKQQDNASSSFILSDLPEKYDKSIYNSAYAEIKAYTKYQEPLATAAKNMLFLLDQKLFELINFKNGYGRRSKKPEYRNVPTVYKKLLFSDIKKYDKKVLKFILDKHKEYQYETAWGGSPFEGKYANKVYNIVNFNIRNIEKYLEKLDNAPPESENNKSNKTKKKTKKDSEVLKLSLSKINIDKARFQNRSKLNDEVLQNIVNNYSDVKLDPVIVWVDPKNKKTYLLAGHHRLEGTRLTGRKSIAAKYFEGSEAEAIKYAKVESNANRSMETETERANIYRELRLSDTPKKDIEQEAKKNEGRNASAILNISYLNPKGITIRSLNSLAGADKQNKLTVERIADWIGQARRNNANLTNAHEVEMFEFLTNKSLSERVKTKIDFLQKITSITGTIDFSPEKPLNLKRIKYKSEGEVLYDGEYKEIQGKIDGIIENRISLKDRLTNPKNPDYINPSDKDYQLIQTALDTQIKKYNDDVKFWQQKLINLQKQKATYTAAGTNQGALFGRKKPALNCPDPVAEVQPTEPKPNDNDIKVNDLVISSKELMNMEFESLEMDGPFANFMQEPAKNMKIAIWGKPKNGKTSGAAQLANYLTKFGNVLYNFVDQGFNKSTQDIWKNSGMEDNPRAFPANARTLDDLEKLCATGNYDFVFIDMVNDYIDKEGVKPYEFKSRFIEQFPDISFILIMEVTKSGNFRGDQKWTHIVDAICTVDNFLMENRGRYGTGHFVVWEKGFKTHNPKRYAELMEETAEQAAEPETGSIENETPLLFTVT